MPYLKKSYKEALDAGTKPSNAGELTYLLTRALQDPAPDAAARIERTVSSYMTKDEWNVEPRYEDYAIVLGCLMSTGCEYERRIGGGAAQQRLGELQQFMLDYYENVIAPYEDQKIKENGDVYEAN